MKIEIRYTIKYQDYRAAELAHFASKLRPGYARLPIGPKVFAFGFLYIGIVGMFVRANSRIPAIVLILMSLAIFGFLILRNFMFKRTYKREIEGFDINYIFSESEIECSCKDFTSHIKWSHYQRFSEIAECFLLYYSADHFNIIPKAAFASDEECNDFRNLITKTISTTVTPA